MVFGIDPAVVQRQVVHGQTLYYCRVCQDTKGRQKHHLNEHFNTTKHQTALQAFHTKEKSSASSQTSLPPVNKSLLLEDALRAILVSASRQPHQPLYPANDPRLSRVSAAPSSTTLSTVSPLTRIDWNLFNDDEIMSDPSPIDFASAQICQATLDFLNSNNESDGSDDGGGSPPLSESSNEQANSDTEQVDNESLPRKRMRGIHTDPAEARKWYLWIDKITCSLDVLMHLPRSLFSRRQLDLFLWLLRINGVNDVPSVKAMQGINKALQNLCGIETKEYKGKLGNVYFVNSLSQILAQEMSNPQVRPFLYFYPEDTGKSISETYQASGWLREINPEDGTPMIRLNNNDFFIFEPTMLIDGRCCIPIQWFLREGVFYAKAWLMEDTPSGWVVSEDREIKITQSQLLKNFIQLSKDHLLCAIHSGPGLSKWTRTDPTIGNRWRVLAKGYRVYSLPLWMYCDDTSGNQSKKWNKHNSYLFILAGLPRKKSSQEYNIHFLCTSDIAPPLEMLDGVVDQLQLAQKHGIWVWDCIHKEAVMIFPPVFALLGDNPMHSEFACHIGMQGKYFCQICWAKGVDSQECPHKNLPHDSCARPNFPTLSIHSDVDSEDTFTRPSHKRRRYKESMESMLRRVSDFIKIGKPRRKKETMATLDSFLEQAKMIGTKSKLRAAKTETGIKDVFQDFFIEKLFKSYKGKVSTQAKEKALKAAVDKLPGDIKSPVWKLGLDPHQDTPVKILHVVLLGFVKYFWRDLVQNQVTPAKKQTLIIRLNSLSVAGLGIPTLNGSTLVNYAGSLTGRDFRIIAQVAPFVIYNMVSQEVYDAWVSLSTLVPVIWQPAISNIDEYLPRLEADIKYFLLKTATWTCAWFNKTKFHIILHLPEHVRRFGPAILFATESFESFNAIIRAKSIHSNHQAPSHDIARGFAQGNRIRHLLSGGFFLPQELYQSWKKDPTNVANSEWRTAGPGGLHLIDAPDSTPASYLGLQKPAASKAGSCKSNGTDPQPFHRTLCGQKLPNIVLNTAASQQLYVTNSQVYLRNEDLCTIGQFVIAQIHPSQPPLIGCVREILQQVGSPNHLQNRPDGILIQTALHQPPSHILPAGQLQPVFMLRLILQQEWSFIPWSCLLCTVNTQHDCQRHGCQANGLQYIYQEQIQTDQTKATILHQNSLDDMLLLNMCQMRDAAHLQSFHLHSAPLNEDAIIQRSVAQAIVQRKVGEASQSSTSKPTKTPTAALRQHAQSPLGTPTLAATPSGGVSLPQHASAGTSSGGVSSPRRSRQASVVYPGQITLDFR
uniref:Uncharacterized protein n=1 Tax=Psilocybe cubensis TaxID=181762 RepID=A0A8H7XVA1_PSICU